MLEAVFKTDLEAELHLSTLSPRYFIIPIKSLIVTYSHVCDEKGPKGVAPQHTLLTHLSWCKGTRFCRRNGFILWQGQQPQKLLHANEAWQCDFMNKK